MSFIKNLFFGFLLHLAVSGFLFFMAFNSGMAAFTYEGATGSKTWWNAYSIWNCGSLAAENVLDRISPLPPAPKTETWPAFYYSAIEKRKNESSILFLLWPLTVGLIVASIYQVRRIRNPVLK